MRELHLFRGLKPFERQLIHISFVGIAYCLYLLQFYNFSDLGVGKLEKEIGYLSDTQADIRVKNYAQTLWQSAVKDQKVREGDKIYTGEKSFALINLNNDSKIELKANSLVEFKKMKNQNVADLEEGEYRVAVIKDLKIAIKGQIANIEGKSEIILKVDKNKKISVETLEGAPTIKYQSKVYNPTKETPAAIDIIAPTKTEQTSSELADEDVSREPSNTEIETPKVVDVQINTESKTYDYTLKMYDVYARDGDLLKLKNSQKTLVRLATPLDIITFDSAKEIFVEYSTNPDLSESRQHSTDSLDRSLAQVYIGDNYWRASQNKQAWSAMGHFIVRPITLPNSRVAAKFSQTSAYLHQGNAELDVQLSTDVNANGYLVESSRTADFDKNSNTHWSYQNKLHLRFHQAGTYFYRFRAVDENLKLGEWSPTSSLEIMDLAPLKAPQFARSQYTTNSDETLLLSWSNPDQAGQFKLAITNANEKTILEKTVKDNSFEWIPQTPGTYKAEVRSVDSKKRVSEPGLAAVIVKAAIVRLSKLTESLTGAGEEENRKTASKDATQEDEVRTQFPTIHLGFNADFILSRVTMSTNYYDTVYSPVLAASDDLPVATPGLQIAGLGWRGHHGGELLFQKNLSSNEAGAADFYSAEARYHYRFYDNTERPDKVAFHISPFVGYEIYGNSNKTYFLSGYSMAKLGAFFEIPIMKSWTMGLTGSYGNGSSMTKYEGLFDVSYFFKKQWTMGFGLKTSVMFGTTSQFPTYPEYREGYSLGQFNLRYFF